MSAYAYYHFGDDKPEINSSRIVRPGNILTYHWGNLRSGGPREPVQWDNSHYVDPDEVHWRCLERMHHEIPYTFDGFKAWLQKEDIVFTDYNTEYFASWDAEDFEKFRDFVRWGALNRENAIFST